MGWAVGIDADVGGVGIAMLLLIVAAARLQRAGRLPVPTQSGVLFWSSVYIPIVVAMAASQNVRAAVTGGAAALLAGASAVAVCFALVPVISRIGQSNTPGTSSPNDEDKQAGGVNT
jgi:malonate transporter MadL subunit